MLFKKIVLILGFLSLISAISTALRQSTKKNAVIILTKENYIAHKKDNETKGVIEFNIKGFEPQKAFDPKKFELEKVNVMATVYTPFPPMTDITASGKKIDTLNPKKHRWLAVSRDLFKSGYVFGSVVIIKGAGKHDGVWTVEDLMNKRFKKRIDFLTEKNDTLGLWANVEMIKLK